MKTIEMLQVAKPCEMEEFLTECIYQVYLSLRGFKDDEILTLVKTMTRDLCKEGAHRILLREVE